MRVKMKNLTFVVLLFTLAFAFAQANLSEENVNLNIFHSASESQSESVSEEPEDDTVLKQQNWSDESTACPQEMFLKDKKCRPCSQCGPDLYERSVCEDNQDTVCDWCLNPNPLKNDDFQLKCSDLIQLQKEFQRALEHTQKSHKLTVIKPVYNNQQQQLFDSLDYL
uniref:TNFR-Cys domain-containing protein n=1 Tax=Ditylenchus dipsaci TaxID=166011 RepID=A0A915EEI6_9BILA